MDTSTNVMTGCQRVVRAIEMRDPDRIPVVFWNRDQARGDVMLYHLSLGVPGDGSVNAWDWSVNEWGYVLEKLGDGTMGHPLAAVYRQPPRAAEIRVPALREAERMSALPAFTAACGNRYRLASLDLSGFTVYTLLRGFADAMQDFLLDEDAFAVLMDRILDFECELIRIAARHGFHGIHFADDWGTQSGLMVSPALWRRLFKPRYARQFALAHELGLHVWYHCCGEFLADHGGFPRDRGGRAQHRPAQRERHGRGGASLAGAAVLHGADQLPDGIDPRHAGRRSMPRRDGSTIAWRGPLAGSLAMSRSTT